MKSTVLLLNSLLFCSLSAVPLLGASSLDSTIPTGNWLATALGEISSERMLADITTLSSPTFLGRQTGTEQDMTSATFFAERFGQLRLHRVPAPRPQSLTNPLPQREWKQAAPISVRTIQDDPVFRLEPGPSRPPFQPGRDFLPVLDSPSADIHASVVFVGYGLSDPAKGIDDYAGLNVQGKIVLFLRGKPETYNATITHSDKEGLARQKGAAGYLTATGPLLTAYEQRRGISKSPSAFYSTTDAGHQLPGAWISTELAEEIIRQGSGGTKSLSQLQAELNRTVIAQSFNTEITVHLQWVSRLSSGTLYNVVSIIRGYAPGNEEAVLIGAHRDHFGQQAGLLFAGADDNASGTAVLLEVARILASSPIAPKRSILFLSFSGEEQGLLGSKLYVSQPIVPLAKTIGMINVDHAGIGNGRLTIGVTGFEKTVAMEAGQSAGLSDRLDLFGFFPGGDHVPFKEAGVPTITVVSGGVHPHFHQPSDTADTINQEILRSAAQYVLALAWQLANSP